MSQPQAHRSMLVFLAAFVLLLLGGASPGPALAGELGSATLQIAGTRLSVSPLGQTVPFDTSTLVETHLEGYDAGLGALPASLKVLGDFSGPGIEGVVSLSTVPNEPFRIPRLRIKGAYALSNIRLVQDGEILGYADPRSVSINATQILITKVSARPLTQDEMHSYGIVVDSSSYQTLNLTFGFAVNGKTFDYNMPVVYSLYSADDGEWGQPAEDIRLPELIGGTVDNPRFQPPRMLPFKLDLGPVEPGEEVPFGGCPLDAGPCRPEDPPAPPMVGVILFPTELTLLHQFFSVVLTVQNGAPEGDLLVVRDLTAKATFPSGLRPAKTEPPTPLGVPVPLRVPGPDGEVGTADDVTFLIAQAMGEAEFLVEGLREGTHLVQFDMAGTLEGLPGGPQPITGTAKGAVVVRDPTLSVTISHPDVVRANEEYQLYLSVTNLGKAPVNALDIGFKTAGLAGTQVLGDATKEIGDLLPGDSRVVEFDMKALITGRVVSSSARAGGSTRPAFDLSVGVADGVPLSPESLVLPSSSKFVPAELYKEALGLVGLAWSLAKAPPSVAGNNPQATEAEMNDRVYRLSQMGRQIALGEEIFEAAAALAAEWLGARDGGWEWDGLRRKTTRGREVARALGEVLAEEIDGAAGVADGSETIDIAERLAATSHYLSPIVLGAYGSGLELEIRSRTSGKAVRGRGAGATRDLPFAELYPLSADAQLAMVARAEEGGYEARLRRLSGAGNVSFVLVLPSPSAEDEPTRLEWPNFVLAAGEVAKLVFDAEEAAAFLSIDEDGDGDEDRQALPSISPLERRPFEVVRAVLDFDVDQSAHVVDLLFSADVDLASLVPRDPQRFRIEGRVSNGGLTLREASISGGIFGGPEIENPLEGLFNPRIVRVVFNNPISPFGETILTVSDLLDSAGREFGEQEVEVTIGPGRAAGAAVVGQVIDPYGQPLPYAEVSLFQRDLAGMQGLSDDCVRHRIARILTDAEGRFRFDYVRQVPVCGSTFELEAFDRGSPHSGRARGEIRFVDQEMTLNVVMLGRAKVRGKVTYGDGSVPPGLQVLAYNPVFAEGRRAKVMPNGEYQMAEVVVGTVTLYAYDELGNRVFQTIEVPAAGAEVVRDLVMLKQSATASAATLRGELTDLADGEPSPGAYVALSIDGQELATRITDALGLFDFGTVPTGLAELVVYHPTTGRTVAQLALSLVADQVAFVELHLRDDRGRFVGYVKRQDRDGTVTPVAGAVVWVEGLPFNTRADANGYYELPDVLTGSWQVSAADLAAKQKVTVRSSVSQGEDTRLDLYIRDTTETPGAIAGTVYGLDGQPVSGATIHLAGDEWSVRYHHEASTDGQGRFRIDKLDPGIYGVHAMKGDDGAIVYANVRFPGDLADIGIQFRRSQIHGKTFTTDDDGNPFGVISLIRYRAVEVVDEWGVVAVSKDYKTLVTNDDGTFAIEALPGPIEMIIHNSFHGTQHRSYHLGAVPVDAQIEFERNGTIKGVVVDHDGETPVPGVELRLSGATFSNYTIHSDENGELAFDLLPPGSYGIMAIDHRNGILREGFTSVLVRNYGDKVDVKVKLPKQGTVFGQVYDADWEPVPNVTVTLHGDRYPRQVMTANTDADGRFTFVNVYAGKIALKAKAPELGGLGGTEQIELGMEGEEVIAEIQIEGAGDLIGRIINPDHGQAVPNAEVRLEAVGIGPHLGYSFTINTDFEGNYRFERLPLGSYRIFTFDPSSGRRGISGWAWIESHGQVQVMDVELEVRGVVEGHLYNDPSPETVPGATIVLDSRGMVRFEVYSSTDIDGHFEFGGIPEGDFELETTVSGRRARNEGRIETEDQVVTRDLHLEALARIEGVVRRPRTAAGPSTALADNVNVLVKLEDRVVAASSENPFIIEGLLPGRYRVEAREIDGDRRVYEDVALAAGDSKTLDLELRGFLPAQVHVFEADGQPAPAGLFVTVHNHYKLANKAGNDEIAIPPVFQTFSGNIASGNTFSIPAVRQGGLNVVVSDPLYPTRKGTASVVTGYEGEVAHVNVSLVATGAICGDVLLPDGVTPAAGARVVVKPVSEGYRITDADENGHFCFDILPRVNFRIDAQQSGGVGTYGLNGAWAIGEYEKTYTIVLDDQNPRVVSVSPAHNATGVPLNAKVVIEFSEPVCRTCGGILLLNAGGWGIGYSAAWSTDGKTVSLTAALQSHTGYRVIVRRPIADLSGREIAYEATSLFQTVDVTPPNVAEMRPANNAFQVPIATTLQVTFSEPIDPNLAPGNFQLVRLDQGNFAETLIPLVIFENRRVALTVTPDLEPNHHYELRVSGIRDTSGNVMAATFTSRFHSIDTAPPAFAWTTPAEGQLYGAGEQVQLAGLPTDDKGVASVEYEIGGRRRLVTAAPWKAQIPAPQVQATGPVTVTAVVKDINGNQATFVRNIVIEPGDVSAEPLVGRSCPADGDWVERGGTTEITVLLSDDQAIDSWELRIDGQVVKTVGALEAPAVVAAYSWQPPAGAAPGTAFQLELAARDFTGQVSTRSWTVTVPTLEPIKSGTLPQGQTHVVGAGDVLLPATSSSYTSVTLLQGARLRGAVGSLLAVSDTFRAQCGSTTLVDGLQGPTLVLESDSKLAGVGRLRTLRVAASGKLRVEAGALVDVTGLGYAAGEGNNPGGAPAGTAGSVNAGGSHGSHGLTFAGTVAPVYDSVYRPLLAGSGGGRFSLNAAKAAGGGVLELEAAEIELDGELRARGMDDSGDTTSTGAGGTVVIRTPLLSGAGLIDAAGGDEAKTSYPSCYGNIGAGGGGRIAILAATLDGFDPFAQARAYGGRASTAQSTGAVVFCGNAGPGTIYVKTAAATYGDLLVDAGTESNGADRVVPMTSLPALGSGAPSAFEAAGGDAWISRTGGFAESWLGVWVELKDGGGASLGVFEAAARDSAGRLRLAGAGALSGVATYQGRYRFDTLATAHGGAITGTDPIEAELTQLAGASKVIPLLTAKHLIVKSGATVRPATGGNLTLKLSGTLTVEAGARIDVSALGYRGGHWNATVPLGPAGVAVSQHAGGSHGGQSDRITQGPGWPGEVYDSVYRPQMSGGGAAFPGHLEGTGGGVLDIEAAALVLDGELRSRGFESPAVKDINTGAGGSIWVKASSLSGSGRIDAAGASVQRAAATCGYSLAAGGGGRVGLLVSSLDGFDPAEQVSAEGGRVTSSTGAECPFHASPGTVYLQTAESTYGDLLIDAGTLLQGGGDRPVPATQLPALGSGAASAFEAAGGDAWLSRGGGFAEKWHGVWVELFASGGGSLGVFEAVERDGAGRLRLEGAGALTGVATFKGRYRFDAVTVRHGAGVSTTDSIDASTTELAGEVELTGAVTAANLTVKAGAVVRPAAGGSLVFRVTGTMTVEAGGVVEVSGKGYLGGIWNATVPTGPAGVGVSRHAGGSHGGQSDRITQGPGEVGEVYDSVYRPQQGGGGAAYSGPLNGAGGGVIDIEAGALVLEGELRSRGFEAPNLLDINTGAGGAILVKAGTLSGGGTIDAEGASVKRAASTCGQNLASGGGGRVSLVVSGFDGFDPGAQVSAEGGRVFTSTGTECPYHASPGTIYFKSAESTYGDLLIDAGTLLVGGGDRPVPATQLPALGSGAASAFEAAGGDAWLSRGGGFAEKWHGVWVELFASGGGSLGVFEAVERDGAGRLRLAGAGALSGVATYKGRYRFDAVTVRHGAGVSTTDSIDTATTELAGNVEVTGAVTAANLTVKAGAVVRPATGGTLVFRVTDTMTVEAGAVLEVSGQGYLGGIWNATVPTGPAGVGVSRHAGGSHGGQSDRITQGPGEVGEVYDSVYRPQQGGGGAAYSGPLNGAGGGVIDIEAGALVLEGELRSRGFEAPNLLDINTGAGGAILVKAGTLSGGGTIDAEGASVKRAASTCGQNLASGGGGRVSLVVSGFDGFDPAAQVSAEGGRVFTSTGAECPYHASPGTIYLKTAESTYGDLVLDAGTLAGGADRVVPATPLPALGTGAASAYEVAGSDAWISRTGGFVEKWHGVWVELLDVHGSVLGIFEAAERDAAGRLRLSGAGSVATAGGYRGVYRFDSLTRLHGAELSAVADPFELGSSLVLGRSVQHTELRLPSLQLASGVSLKPLAGTLRLKVSGALTVAAGAKIDLTGAGYAGNYTVGQPGGSPAGVAGSVNAGGSHGGSGDTVTGAPGAIYDSVYFPSLGGGGGSKALTATSSRGAGVLDLEAGSLVLDGEILARGDSFNDQWTSAGAGGSVRIVAGDLSGSGVIDASGGGSLNGCQAPAGAGGGGRVAISATTLTGFDPATQARAWAGRTDCWDTTPDRYAAAGTLLVRTGGQSYGTLHVDAGLASATGERVLPTHLPILGSFAVASAAVVGGDLWVSAATAFPEAWLGTFVQLENSAGEPLGLYRADERNAAGRLRLTGAAGASAAVAGRGFYRFDQVVARRGALVLVREIYGQPALIAGDGVLEPEYTGTDLKLAAGAVVRPKTGSRMSLQLSGTLTIEAGARLDVSGSSATTAPAGYTASTNAGGSHGGRGDAVSGTPGAVFDSVYRPTSAGGAGHPHTLPAADGRGGGVVEIAAASVVLDGQVLARGGGFTRAGASGAGAGGTVRIHAAEMSGAGLVDVSGGTLVSSDCSVLAGGGGGGRVALEVADLDAFTVADRVRAWPGVTDCSSGTDRFAAAGTVYVNTTGSTYGRLLVDGGESWNGAPRTPFTTRLPQLGEGTPTAITASGGDAWLEKSGGFPEHWWGVWVELSDASSTLLGTYRVAERDSAGRLRLSGAAASAATATTYNGIYRFDQIDTVRGGQVDTGDPGAGGPTTVLEGQTSLSAPVVAVNLLIKSSAVIKPASGTSLTFRVSGKMTVEAGATIDVSALNSGGAPSGFGGPDHAGGSHGGGGDTRAGTIGATYDSVYRPQMAGSAGFRYNHYHAQNLGGGVIDIEAGALVLKGQLLANGSTYSADVRPTGAGGSVRIKTGQMSGTGSIEAIGGTAIMSNTCGDHAGGGGGGRVGLAVTSFSGFDPASQVKVWGGVTDCSGTSGDRFASPGTLYLRTEESTYGDLLIDAGDSWDGAPRTPRPTKLPTLLSSAAFTSLTAAGADAWLVRSGAFAEQWWGVWVELRNAGGTVLGTYEAVERDGTGRLRLAGAASAVGSATGYKGVYRFDNVKLKNGAGFDSPDLHQSGQVEISGRAELATPLTATGLVVRSGATLRPAPGTTGVTLRVAGTVTVEEGATVDVSTVNGGRAPSGFVSADNAGGSHGGAGETKLGTLGATYDSVYRPVQPGSKGYVWNYSNAANLGGGVIDIEAGQMVLEGSLLANGASYTDIMPTSAGGSVRIKTGELSGDGAIEAIGGTLTMTASCSDYAGGGGGGRVGLEVSSFAGFDPEAQVKVWGGVTDCTGAPDRFAAPGTLYYRTPASTYGTLVVDAGDSWNGATRSPRPTRLPLLGSGTLTSATAAGADAWLVKSGNFGEVWWGVWVELRNAGGTLLGTFEVVERDATGRLRLAGAGAAAATATAYKGLYRFDAVTLRNGGGFDAGDAHEPGDLELSGRVELGTTLTALSLVVKSGATVRPAAGLTGIGLRVTGTLTIEAGAKLDVSALNDARAPSGFVGGDGGGSHGGGGETLSGVVGDTYGSVYVPLQPGGKGYRWMNGSALNLGGGVIDIEAGNLALGGSLLANGASFEAVGLPTAAGGSVRIKTGQLSGSGAIEALGGSLTNTTGCEPYAGGGGGGRVSLQVNSFSGFDPESQVKVWGGVTDCSATADRFASPGTLYYSTAGSTYGHLVLDAGSSWQGAARTPKPTRLPALGNGNLTSITAAGDDAWVVKSGNFGEVWLGVWVELRTSGSVLIGTYKVTERDGTGRLRLAGAASAAATATAYKGLYRFDSMKLKNGAGFDSGDSYEPGAVELNDRVTLGSRLAAASLSVKTGALIKPSGTGTSLAFRVSGTMTVESGATIDVSALNDARSPSGFGAGDGGGSHGGGGETLSGVVGDTYGSVYVPLQPGSKGYRWMNNSALNLGGGVIDIEAGNLALGGSLLANGASYEAVGLPTAAGGSVRIKTGALSGGGAIEALGGSLTNTTGCEPYAGGGGGGRISLDTASFAGGFDPAVQAKAWGGITDCSGTASDRFAAPGTLYWKTSASTYGNLLLDAGSSWNSAPRTPKSTKLPSLANSAAFTSLTAAGSDAWLVRTGGFTDVWVGAWVELRDAGASLLGTYRVIERDGTNRLLLAGASSAAGTATAYKGLYRFDSLKVKNGASLAADDAFDGGAIEISGASSSPGVLAGTSLLVKSGTFLRPGAGTSLAIRLSGALTVEAGAALDVSAIQTERAPSPYAPVWAGGGHGGSGDTVSGTAGTAYDSVYRPQLTGSAGHGSTTTLNRGGGVLDIQAGSVALAGDLLAHGATFTADGFSTGAGGTVRVKTGVLSGSGAIDASGGTLNWTGTCFAQGGAGGGGRVRLEVSSFSSFDPDTQTKAWAGVTNCTGTAGDRFAAAGTIYWKTPSSTYGTLRVAGGDDWNGVVRATKATVLPTLGNGAFTTLTATGSDAWMVRSGNFPEHWLGVWVELKDASSTVIGTYEAVERNASGHLRLAGASGAAGTATSYRGFYRFDEVKLRQGSTLSGADTIEAGAYTSSWTPDGDGEELESLALAGEGEAPNGDPGEEDEGFDLEGLLFNDLDGDGVAGSTEPPIVGVRVGAYAGTGEPQAEAITDRLGRYRLSAIPAGSLVAVDADSLPGGVDLPSADADGVDTPDRAVFGRHGGETDRRRFDFGYRQADLALSAAAPAPVCDAAGRCAPADRATPAPAAAVCLAGAPVDTVFLLDLGGLAAPFAGAASRLEAAQLAFAALERQLAERGDGSRAALLTYRGAGDSAEVHLLQGLSERHDAFEDRLFGLAAQDLLAGPAGSPAAVALRAATDLLAHSLGAGRQPRLVWLSDGEPNVDARLRPAAGFGGELQEADGGFRRAAEVALLGGFSRRFGTFGGQAMADAMVAIEEAGFRAPGLRIDAIALRAGGRAPSEDLHDYAAAFTAGRRAAAADLAALEMAIEDLAKTSVCAAR